MKSSQRTPTNKNKGKTQRANQKDSIPFEYKKESISAKKNESDKRTPSRSSRDISPNMHFMSPTQSSRHKRSNQKNLNKKNMPKKLYTVEDLEGAKKTTKEVSKKLHIDKVDREQEIASYMDNTSEKVNSSKIVRHHTDEGYIPERDIKSNKTHSLKGSFKSAQNPDDSHERSLKGNLNTPVFQQDVHASKLSTIEK